MFTPWLNKIKVFLVTNYVTQSFKIAAIKHYMDTEANYRPVSGLPFLLKILKKAVGKQLCDFFQDNILFEHF